MVSPKPTGSFPWAHQKELGDTMSGGPLVQSSPDTMSGQPLQRKVTLAIPMGLHFRPAAALAKLAATFPGNVVVLKEERRANGKSMMELMMLAAECGTELLFEADGPDAPQALDALANLLASWEEPPEDDDRPTPPKG
jgi:phosphocarrier protein HPr